MANLASREPCLTNPFIGKISPCLQMSPRIATTTLSYASWCQFCSFFLTVWYFSQTNFLLLFLQNSCWFLHEISAHHHQSLLEGGSTQCDDTHHSVRDRGYNNWSSMPEPFLLKNPCSGGCVSWSFPRDPSPWSKAPETSFLRWSPILTHLIFCANFW